MATKNIPAAIKPTALNIRGGDYATFGRKLAERADRLAADAAGYADWLRASLGDKPNEEAIETARVAATQGYLIVWGRSLRTVTVGDVEQRLPTEEMGKYIGLTGPEVKKAPLLVREMLRAGRNAARVDWSRMMDRAYPERVEARAVTKAAAEATGAKTAGRPPSKGATTKPTEKPARPAVLSPAEVGQAMLATLATLPQQEALTALGAWAKVIETAASAIRKGAKVSAAA